jgi:hypothetical protein
LFHKLCFFKCNVYRYEPGTRSGGGIAWAMMGGLGIGLPPILNFGLPQNRALQEKCVKVGLCKLHSVVTHSP